MRRVLAAQSDCLPAVEERLRTLGVPFIKTQVEEGGMRVTQVCRAYVIFKCAPDPRCAQAYACVLGYARVGRWRCVTCVLAQFTAWRWDYCVSHGRAGTMCVARVCGLL